MKMHVIVLAGLAGALSVALAGEMGQPLEVAPKVKDTRNQVWASAAWCEGAKCWLVVWREGYLNEQKGDIWCARVSADPATGSGQAAKSLDPAGIKLTPGEGFRDRPRVASDGKKFMVVWEEVTTGAADRSWDVFGTVISSDGRSAVTPFLLAGGSHNQSRPDVAFAQGSYHVLYMAYGNDVYSIRGMRLSPDGKPVGDNPVVVAAVQGKADNLVSVTLPAVAANAEGDLLSAFLVRDSYRVVYMGRRPIDAATGQPSGAAPTAAREKDSPGGKGWGGRERRPALAMGPDGAISVSSAETFRSKNDIIVGRLSKTGEVLGLQEAGAGSLGISDPFKPISARFAVACAGKAYLAVGEVLSSAGDKKKGGGGSADCYARVIGWRITPDGNPEGEAFAVAGESGKECVLPSVAAGPDGSCLVVYSELRGIDDVKVLARVVK